MRKKVLFCLLMIFIMVITSIPAYAATEQQTTDQSVLLKTLLDNCQKDMDKAGVKHESIKDSMTTSTTTTLNIGINKTFTWGDALNSGYSGSGVGTHGEGAGYVSTAGYADAGTYIALVGNVSDWAWIGNAITIGGSGSRSATITFKGKYKGILQAVGSGGGAAGRIRVSVCDLGSDTDIGGNTVLDKSVSTGSTTYSASINHPVTVTLYAGHTYALRFGVATTSTASLTKVTACSQFADSSSMGSWSPQPGGYGVDYSSIVLQWN